MHKQGLFGLDFVRVHHFHILVVDVVIPQRLHVSVELEYERRGVGNPQPEHGLVVDAGEHLDETAAHVLMRREQQRLVVTAQVLQVRHYLIFPVWGHPLSNHFERLSLRKSQLLVLAQMRV